MDKVLVFIDKLNNDEEIKRLVFLKNKLAKDKDLLSLIEHVKAHPEDIEAKRKVLSNSDYSEYKQLENNLYFLILKMNSATKSLAEKGSSYVCHKR